MGKASVAAGLFFGAFVLSLMFSAVVRRVAPRFGLVDNPGGRKAHRAPTPLGGGVAFWLATVTTLGVCAGVAWLGRAALPPDLAGLADGAWSKAWQLLILLGLSALMMVMGLVDDRVGLDWRLRIGVQFALAAIYVLAVEQATIFQSNRWLAAAITIVWIVGLTNAFNFLDNMDGLAGSVGLIAALLFAGAQVAVGSVLVPGVLLALAGALCGFLVFNVPPARLFMGDAGSNALGFLLGTLTVTGTFTRAGYSPLAVLAPLLVMAVPLYDTCSVVLIRLREGRSPFQADRSHFSHRLVQRGLSPPQAVATIDLVTLASGLGALLLHRVSAPWEAVVLAGQTACLIGVIAMLELGTNRTQSRKPEDTATASIDPHAHTETDSASAEHSA